MNSLTKIQLDFIGFVLVTIAALLTNIYLLVLLCIPIAYQIYLQTELKRDYPEDWRRYVISFVFFEVVVISIVWLFKSVLSGVDLLSNIVYLSQMFLYMIVILLVAVVAGVVIKRRYTYGSVTLVSRKGIGVKVNNDLFSGVNAAEYVVENPGKIKIKKGERVKIAVEKPLFGKPMPKYIKSRAK